MDTLAIIKELLVENLDVEEGLITEEATFESLGVDSLDMVELICELEEKCEIDFGEPEGLETIGDLIAYVASFESRQAINSRTPNSVVRKSSPDGELLFCLLQMTNDRVALSSSLRSRLRSRLLLLLQ